MSKEYTKEFKIKHGEEALRLSEAHELSQVEYARKHGIPRTTLHKWVNACRNGAGAGEEKQSFVALKPTRPIRRQEEHVVISTSFCTLTVSAAISSEDLMKVMKSIRGVC
jgi:transposase-like protein